METNLADYDACGVETGFWTPIQMMTPLAPVLRPGWQTLPICESGYWSGIVPTKRRDIVSPADKKVFCQLIREDFQSGSKWLICRCSNAGNVGSHGLLHANLDNRFLVQNSLVLRGFIVAPGGRCSFSCCSCHAYLAEFTSVLRGMSLTTESTEYTEELFSNR